jgi:hypothetical protein
VIAAWHAAWAWLALTVGPWVVLVAFGLTAVVLLVIACALVEVTRRQRTRSETIVGAILVVLVLAMAVVCGGVAWALGPFSAPLWLVPRP